MPDEAAFAATAAVLRSLAKGRTTKQAAPASHLPLSDIVNGPIPSQKILLPGEESDAKHELESEIAALVSRVRYLEAKAAAVNHHTLPDTPNENGLDYAWEGVPENLSRSPDPQPLRLQRPNRLSAADRGTSLLNSILAPKDSLNGSRDLPQHITAEEFGYLRDHVNQQSEQIQNQKAQLASLNLDLSSQTNKTAEALKQVKECEAGRVQNLERELYKNQQANEAFQKVLREIGQIITAVARGDLSQKVLIHSMEIDPEITTFKQTINTMMDQLQVFASEVSRVAREVGTEGRLGGQAQITGVGGTWKELTENGKLFGSCHGLKHEG